jgi:hypothetical protein
LIAAIFGTGCGIVTWTYQRGSARLGIVDLYGCEIATICRVVTIVGVAGRYVELYRTPPTLSMTFNSEEHYTPVFDNNSKDLEVLEARVVEPVTEFYTYLKSMRDYLRLLRAIEHPDTEMVPWQTRLIALSQACLYLAATLHSRPDLGARFGCGPSRLGAFQSPFFCDVVHA